MRKFLTVLFRMSLDKFDSALLEILQKDCLIPLRDPDESKLKNAENKLNNFLKLLEEQEGVQVEQKQLDRFEPVHFNEKIVQLIESSANKLGFSYRRMTSGAGHDAQMIARIAPTAMIFVPSKGGVSHNPREFTEPKQLINGANVLLEVVQNLV